MARHIHIHLPARTNDAGWEESKHPRKDDGKFGSGGKTKQGITGLGESDLADKDRHNAGKDDPVHGGGGEDDQQKESAVKRFRELGDQLAKEGKWAEAAEHYEAALKELKAKYPNANANSVKHLTDGISRFQRAAARKQDR